MTLQIIPWMSRLSDTWYTQWFDTRYYELLYSSRGVPEANAFVDRLVQAIPMVPGRRVLDIPCGWGRHAARLQQKGFSVVGLDINDRLIQRARDAFLTKAISTDDLCFEVHDMRKSFDCEGFDYVLNLFTSIGYFETVAETAQAIVAMVSNLKPQGYFVLDYLHAPYVRATLVPLTHTTIQGIDFEIHKRIVNDIVIKDIYVQDQGQRYHYQERVLLFDPRVCEGLLRQAGLVPCGVYGSYDLDPLGDISTRFICISKRQS